MPLNVIWFILVFVLLTGYAVLDGFDFGVGVLHLLGKSDHERRVGLNAIGPVWDGNEVWLLTGGGALFAAFPPVYATVFSGFYLALMLLLVALMFRAVSIEFRGKVHSPIWKHSWDAAFFIGSLLPPVLLGVAFGNILRGLPIDATGNFTGTFLGLLNPFALLIGVLTLIIFTLHGATFLSVKSDGAMRNRLQSYIPKLWAGTVLFILVATAASVTGAPFLFDHAEHSPLAWAFATLLAVCLIILPFANDHGRALTTFYCSAGSIAALMGLAASSLFPRLVPSITDLENSLTIYNSSSTPKTLATMLIIALIGMPLVIAYTSVIYGVFRGRVVLGDESY
jgi:cytochrome d ubiquinol oxidase subunit II